MSRLGSLLDYNGFIDPSGVVETLIFSEVCCEPETRAIIGKQELTYSQRELIQGITGLQSLNIFITYPGCLGGWNEGYF